MIRRLLYAIVVCAVMFKAGKKRKISAGVGTTGLFVRSQHQQANIQNQLQNVAVAPPANNNNTLSSGRPGSIISSNSISSNSSDSDNNSRGGDHLVQDLRSVDIGNTKPKLTQIDEVNNNNNGEYIYIDEVVLNAKEDNILPGLSPYVRGRVVNGVKIGHTDRDGLARLSVINRSNLFSLATHKMPTNNGKLMESFWLKELEPFIIGDGAGGEWLIIPKHIKWRIMKEMNDFAVNGYTHFRGVNYTTFAENWEEYLTCRKQMSAWKEEWDIEMMQMFTIPSDLPPPSEEYNPSLFFSPTESLQTLLPSNISDGSISVFQSLSDIPKSLLGKQVFYILRPIVPKGTILTPRDIWILSRYKFGSSDDIYGNFQVHQVGCQFKFEIMVFVCGDNYIGIESAMLELFDPLNCRGEWTNLLRPNLQFALDIIIKYQQSSSDLSWSPIGSDLTEEPTPDVTRIVDIQANSLANSSGRSVQRKLGQIRNMIDDYNAQFILIQETCIKKDGTSLKDKIGSDLISSSTISANENEQVSSHLQYLPGGVGLAATTNSTGYSIYYNDPYGRFLTVRLAKDTIVVNAYAPRSGTEPMNSKSMTVVQQGQRIINQLGLQSQFKSTRHMFEHDITKHIRELTANGGTRVILLMDANEDIHNGDFCCRLVTEMGMTEVSSLYIGTDVPTNAYGTRPIRGVWVTTKHVTSIKGLMRLPMSQSAGDHATEIIEFYTDIDSKSKVVSKVFNQSSAQVPTFLGMNCPITKSNFRTFTNHIDMKTRDNWSKCYDAQTNSLLLLDGIKSPTYTTLVKSQYLNRSGGLQEDEYYLYLEGLRRYGFKLTKIMFDANNHDIGLSFLRRNIHNSFGHLIGTLFEMMGINIAELKKSNTDIARHVFGLFGYASLDDVPNHWWLTLPNKFMLQRLRKNNNSTDKVIS